MKNNRFFRWLSSHEFGKTFADRRAAAMFMRHPERGALNEQSVVSLMIVGLLAAILVPIAIDQFVGVSTTSWSTTTQTIWNNLPVILAVALLLGFVGFFARQRASGGGKSRK